MISSTGHATGQDLFQRLRAKALFSALALLVIFTALSEGVQAATTPVHAWDNLQQLINNAAPGDTLVLDAGASFDGPITLPVKAGSSYVTITSSAISQLPDGQRVSYNQASLMPRIISRNGSAAIRTDAGAHHYRIVGVEITVASGVYVDTLITLGSGDWDQYSLTQVPHHITLDRCYIHGLAGQALKRGVALNSASTEVRNCYVSECHLQGQDSQAVMGWNGPGPFQIINNYLEGAGENLMFGGADPKIQNMVPSDIEVRRNYLAKPTAWRYGANWTEKNLLELKNAQRVVIDGNFFENSWADAQDGYAILFTVRNQEGGAPWSVVQDVQFTSNIVRHAGGGVQLLGIDYIYPSQRTKRINISNNLFDDINSNTWGGHGWFMGISDGVENLVINHNTIFQNYSIIHAGGSGTTGFVFTNNIVQDNGYGFSGDGVSPGYQTLNTYYPYNIFRRNVIAGTYTNQNWPYYYPADNYYLDWASFNSQFVNRAGGDYRIASTSPGYHGGTDGKDVGADIAVLNALASVIGGNSGAVGFSSSSYTISEGAASTPQGYPSLSVNVVRGGDLSTPASVKYFTSDQSGGNECNQVTGNASQRCDYTLQAGTLRFGAGESTKTINIPIVSDGYVEGSEVFTINLQSSAGTNLGLSQATVIIQDDDTVATTPSQNYYQYVNFFVRQLYLDILGREPDSSGFATWTGVLNNCANQGFLGAPPQCDRPTVAHGFIASPEFTDRGYLIYRMYEVGMVRLPRYNELMPDMTMLSGQPGSAELEQNTVQFADEFTMRPGFTSLYGDVMTPSQAAQLIGRLEQYAGVTLPATTTTQPGQPPQYGRQELINKRQTGEFTVGQTLRAFVQQKVVYDKFFERGYVTMQYFGFLRRDPDLNDPNLNGWRDWVNVFTNGTPDGAIQPRDIHHLIFGFIYSEEYRKRFGAP
jgi:Calx-beta domain/Domain of unknown function (DUF4214)